MDKLEDKLKHRAEIREKKTSLQLLLNISESVAKVEGLLQISGSECSAPRDGNERYHNKGVSANRNRASGLKRVD